VRAYCVKYGITVALVDPNARQASAVAALLTTAFGAPVITGGMYVWPDVLAEIAAN